MVRVCTRRGLRAVRDGHEQLGMPAEPILLWGESNRNGALRASHESPVAPIKTNINGNRYTFDTGFDKTLLRLLREEVNLIGTKEGCAEGECGACTVFLDGKAVMACLVPAPRAHGAEIVTIECLEEVLQRDRVVARPGAGRGPRAWRRLDHAPAVGAMPGAGPARNC